MQIRVPLGSSFSSTKSLRAAPSADEQTDRFQSASDPELDFKEAVKELFKEKKKNAEPLNPDLDWKIEKARSLPWIGESGEMFLGVTANQATPFESTVQFRNSHDHIRWTREVKGNLEEQTGGL